MKGRNRSWPSIDPCGTPEITLHRFDLAPFISVLYYVECVLQYFECQCLFCQANNFAQFVANSFYWYKNSSLLRKIRRQRFHQCELCWVYYLENRGFGLLHLVKRSYSWTWKIILIFFFHADFVILSTYTITIWQIRSFIYMLQCIHLESGFLVGSLRKLISHPWLPWPHNLIFSVAYCFVPAGWLALQHCDNWDMFDQV